MTFIDMGNDNFLNKCKEIAPDNLGDCFVSLFHNFSNLYFLFQN